MMVIAGMIGIPVSEWTRFRRWSESLLKMSYSVSGGAQAYAAAGEIHAVSSQMKAYVAELIERRTAEPKNDLLTHLVEAEVDGERLTEDEILGFVKLLVVAGNETSANLINNTLLSLLENPRELARLREIPDLLPSAIEEVLRYRSPVQWVLRATARAVQVGGTRVPAGQLVLAMIGSANRDARVFEDAGHFDITRDPNPHLAFGHGIHFCLGAGLARLEARVALAEFFGRARSFELADAGPWEPREALHVHGPNRLPIRFEMGRHAGVIDGPDEY
jgi:cytochrome P450